MVESSVDRVRAFRSALGAFATGVTIVTTRHPDGFDIGLTANSFNSVSLEPPMVLWSLAKNSKNLQAFEQAHYFAVHILAAEQEALSGRFARPQSDKFAGLDITRGLGDVPLLPECSARFQCRTAFRYDGGDHVIFVGQVEDFEHRDRPPLVFHGGKYALAVNVKPAAASEPQEPDSSFSEDFLIYLLGRAHHQMFLQVRLELERHGLSEEGWFVLSLLGVSNDRMLSELERLLAYTGKEVTYDLVAGLAAAGFVELRGSYDPHARVSLTEMGRAIVVELVAAAKVGESEAYRNLNASEVQLLKQALRQIIRDSMRNPVTRLLDRGFE
jgi:3-hydroxy-9,10-secoandrosta-1,3,5(10)-triene-9,17-dione monooxygenase reductase component